VAEILIVEDDPIIRQTVDYAVRRAGFTTRTSGDGVEALQMARAAHPDLILLDLMLPGIDGFEFASQIRRTDPDVAIIMVTALGEERDTVRGLDAGADDYITKPFNIRELAARIRAAVRRSSASRIDPDAAICIGKIELDPARRIVRKAGEPVHLTPKEFDLLRYLMAHAGLPITHLRLLHAVWGPDYGGELEYLRTFVRQLRKKLEDDPGEPAYLLTDSHIGYRFAEAKPEPVEENARG
jgi:two-component system KDP operon response regulator KdpE